MNYEQYIIPGLIIIYLGYRIFKSKQVRKNMPELKSKGAIIIDVRSVAEFNGGNNPNSINIPVDQIAGKLGELDKSKTYILCCASGGRSGMAEAIMKAQGFKDVHNAGPWTNTLD